MNVSNGVRGTLAAEGGRRDWARAGELPGPLRGPRLQGQRVAPRKGARVQEKREPNLLSRCGPNASAFGEILRRNDHSLQHVGHCLQRLSAPL